MKIKLLSILLLLAMVASMLTGCIVIPGNTDQGGQNNTNQNGGTQNGGTQNGGNNGVACTALTAQQRCMVEPFADPYSTMVSFKDARYYYYIIKLGTIRNVPLDAAPSHNFTGGNDTMTITVSSTSEEVISSMISTAEHSCISGTLSVGGSYGNNSTMARVEAGFSLTTSSGTTRSKSIANTKAYSTQNSSSITFDMSGKQPGYYRYTLMGDVQVNASVIYDTKTDTYEYSTYSTILGQGYMLDFSEGLVFETNGGKIDYKFDKSRFDGKVPTTELPPSADYSYLPEPFLYDSGYERKKIDGSYQLRYDTIDMHELSAFLTKDYKLTFAISVYMEEENAGIQEVFLINDSNTCVGKNDTIEYGGSGSAYDTKGWYSDGLTFTVTGDKCTPMMHIEYGAHGTGSDDWIRYQAKVTVTVEVKQ